MEDTALKAIEATAERGEPIGEELAMSVLGASAKVLPRLFSIAGAVRSRRFGEKISLCSIVNAKGGACPEDCAFCAQASRHHTGAKAVPLFSEGELVGAYESAAQPPIGHFGVVTSGCALSPEGVERICRAIASKKAPGVEWCASLGCLEAEQLAALKRAGLKRFHHNLETAPSFFPTICTTHTFEQRLATVRSARAAGLEVCCGGIMGVGESPEQRVELALLLAREAVDSIPLNFLIPIPGTRLGNMAPMPPLDMLRTVAMFRLTNPRSEVRVCGGRGHLKDLQAMIFLAGANGMMIGPLLTVAGRSMEDDVQMLRDLEML